MTRHLSPEDFLDVADGAGADAAVAARDRAAHLAACAECAEQLQMVREALAMATPGGDVPEPSPLFWDHLSARVRQAVAHEPIPASWWAPYWRPVVAVAGGIGIVMLIVAGRPGSSASGNVPSNASPVAATAAIEVAGDQALQETSDLLDQLADATPSIATEDLSRAGLMPSARATDAAIESLSPSERAELVRLLRAELGATE